MNLVIKKDLVLKIIEELLLDGLEQDSQFHFRKKDGLYYYLEDIPNQEIENIKAVIEETISNIDKMDNLMNNLRPMLINLLKKIIISYEDELKWRLNKGDK